MEGTSARLLRLLSLLQSRPEWAGADLAGRLGVTDRTVRRDVDRLRGLGYPVNASRGVAGGYRLRAGGTLPPLLLDDEEAVAVVVGLRTAAAGSIAGLNEASVRALAKLEQVLPVRLRDQVTALHESTVELGVAGGPTVDAATLVVIANACRGGQRLRFGYRSRAGTGSDRTVEPHRLVHTGRRWYLVAWDVDRGGWRTFRVDRLDRAHPTGQRCVPREPPDAAAYVSESISTTQYRVQARIRFSAPMATMAECFSPTAGRLTPDSDGGCVLTTGSHSLDSIAIHLALTGHDFEVLDPPELNDHLRALAARLTRGATTPPRSPRSPRRP